MERELDVIPHSEIGEIKKDQWDALRARPTASLTMSRPWVRAALATVDADSDPFLVAVRERGLLVGLLPLVRREDHAGPCLHFAGSPHNDMTDVLVLPGREARAGAAALEFLRETSARVDLDDLDPSGNLAAAGRATGVLEWLGSDPASTIDLRAPWETLVSKSRRKRLDKDMGRLHEHHQVKIGWVTGEDVVAALPDFAVRRRIHLEARGRPLDLPPVSLLEAVVASLAPRSRCALIELSIDGDSAAADLLLLDFPVAMSWVCLLEPHWRRYSCGNLLLRETARRLRHEGYQFLDLGRGEEPYKFEMGAGPRRLLRMTRPRPEHR